MKLLIALVVGVAIVAIVVAFPLQASDDPIRSLGLPSVAEFSAQLLPELEGTVSWRTLAEVEPVPVNGKLVPKFSNAILDLDKKGARIYGFIIPLGLGADQKHFLISAVPPDCPFCMQAGPDAIVEVQSRKPIEYGPDPVLLTGKFAVLKDDPGGILYRMTEAVPIAVGSSGKR